MKFNHKIKFKSNFNAYFELKVCFKYNNTYKISNKKFAIKIEKKWVIILKIIKQNSFYSSLNKLWRNLKTLFLFPVFIQSNSFSLDDFKVEKKLNEKDLLDQDQVWNGDTNLSSSLLKKSINQMMMKHRS